MERLEALMLLGNLVTDEGHRALATTVHQAQDENPSGIPKQGWNPQSLWDWRQMGVVFAVLLLSALITSAQDFSIDWCTIDGGGGASAGGNYSLIGSIGQLDAGVTMTNGGFSIVGGFWSIFAVRTPDAPRLTMQRISASSVRVVWPSPSTGFVLQQNSDFNTANWVNASQAVSDSGTNRFITVNPSSSRLFYRLFKP